MKIKVKGKVRSWGSRIPPKSPFLPTHLEFLIENAKLKRPDGTEHNLGLCQVTIKSVEVYEYSPSEKAEDQDR